MQDVLVPIFGEDGSIIAQYVITLAVIVALIGLVVWGVRHYTRGTVHMAARGRLPRLAIVDTLPVDNKRKLVLLRRDNVEHLILIGGPSDLVVEPTIIRQRVAQRPTHGAGAARPAAAQAVPAPPPPAAAESSAPATPEPREAPAPRVPLAESEAPDTTVHFPVRRAVSHAGADRAAFYRRDATVAVQPAAGHHEPRRSYRAVSTAASEPEPEALPAGPHRREPVGSRVAASGSRPETASRFAPPLRALDEPPDGPVPGYEPDPEPSDHEERVAHAPTAADVAPDSAAAVEPVTAESPDGEAAAEAPTTAADAADSPAAAEGKDVGDLEEEMARLLDQISTTRRE